MSTGIAPETLLRDVIVELFRAVDERDWDRLPGIFHANVVYDRPGYDSLTGIAEVLRFYREERVIAQARHHLERVIASGDQVAVCGRVVGQQKDGDHVDESFADIYSFDDTKIITRKTFFYRPAV